jgi:hypothetical protein
MSAVCERIDGKIRAIHTLTVCKTFNCGFPVPEALTK